MTFVISPPRTRYTPSVSERCRPLNCSMPSSRARCQILVVPTVATTTIAADFDYSEDQIRIAGRQVDPILGWVLTYPFNIPGRCPVLNIPAGLAANGVPIGIQIIGRSYDDVSVFAARAAAERSAGGPFLSRCRPAALAVRAY